MARLTKTQKKRLVKEIESKAKKLYMVPTLDIVKVVNTKDMEAIEKLCAKFMKRIG